MSDPRSTVTIPKDLYAILMERYTMNDVKRISASIERDEANLHVRAMEDVHQILALGVQESARKLAAAQEELSKVYMTMEAVGVQLIHLHSGNISILK